MLHSISLFLVFATIVLIAANMYWFKLARLLWVQLAVSLAVFGYLIFRLDIFLIIFFTFFFIDSVSNFFQFLLNKSRNFWIILSIGELILVGFSYFYLQDFFSSSYFYFFVFLFVNLLNHILFLYFSFSKMEKYEKKFSLFFSLLPFLLLFYVIWPSFFTVSLFTLFWLIYIGLLIRSTFYQIKKLHELNLKYREKLFNSEREYLKIFENSPAIYVFLDMNFTIIECNKKLSEAIGLSVDKILDSNLIDFVPDVFKAKMNLLKNYLKYHETASGEFALINYNKKDSIDVFMSAIKENNTIFIIMQDITAIKWMQNSLTSYVEQLKKEMEHSKNADKMKSVFLANMSHEIRTPLTSIIGFSSLLKETPLEETQQDYVNKILTSGEHLLKIINDIIDLSKIEAGKMDIEIEKVDMRKVFEDVYHIVYPQVYKKKLELKITLDEELKRRYVFLDGFRLKQVFINLLSNSIKFTKEGFVALRGIIKDQQVIFEVEDTGIGIPKDKQQRVFEPFVQAEDNLDRTYGGTGLGLAISQRLVHIMDGKIELFSEEGQGTIMRVIFSSSILSEELTNEAMQYDFDKQKNPITVEAEKEIETIKEEKNKVVLQKEKPVLLVGEDDDAVYTLLDFVLQKNHILAVRGKTGNQVMDFFKIYSDSLKLALLDINLPEIEGTILAKKIKEQNPQMKVIGFSAYHYDEVKDRIAGQMDDYIKKPFKINDIFKILKKYL